MPVRLFASVGLWISGSHDPGEIATFHGMKCCNLQSYVIHKVQTQVVEGSNIYIDILLVFLTWCSDGSWGCRSIFRHINAGVSDLNKTSIDLC